MVYDWIAAGTGESTRRPRSRSRASSGCSPTSTDGQWLHRPRTILVDSSSWSPAKLLREFRRAAAAEIEEFKRRVPAPVPRPRADEVDDAEILREVMNTVGKRDKLGEQVRCVVSVSMLTEGWDANTVTHILGVRAFGTQLLCEQVVGRGLRRRSYAADENGILHPGVRRRVRGAVPVHPDRSRQSRT